MENYTKELSYLMSVSYTHLLRSPARDGNRRCTVGEVQCLIQRPALVERYGQRPGTAFAERCP